MHYMPGTVLGAGINEQNKSSSHSQEAYILLVGGGGETNIKYARWSQVP